MIENASLLPKLQPIMAVTFALNVAYVGLPRFRYRDTVRRNAGDALDSLNTVPDEVLSTNWYTGLHWLAGRKKSKEPPVVTPKRPDHFWTRFYAIFYATRFDRFLACTAILVFGVLIATASAHDIGTFLWTAETWGLPAVNFGWARVLLYLCVSFGTMPAIFVFFGGKYVIWAESHLHSVIEDYEKGLQSIAQTADVKKP